MRGEWRKLLAMRTLEWATRLYPAEQRGWGEAILGEAEGLEPEMAWAWMLGGLTVAVRTFISGLLRPRAGRPEAALAGPPTHSPPLPWKAALICLGMVGLLFFLPEMRQGVEVTLSTWQNSRPSARQWEEMGREAESRGDAAAMAFAAMRLPGDQGMKLAERAVARDAGLTWALYFVERRGAQEVQPRLHPELLLRVQRWDPGNAVPYLAAAQETSPFPFAPGGERDPRWRPLMEEALAAPRYDDYIGRRLRLDREVMRRWKRGGPIDTLATIFSLPLPSVKDLLDYSKLRLGEGAEAERAGRWEQAAAHYWAVAHFAQRMRLGAQTDLEQVVAAYLQKTAFERLQPVLVRLGRLEEAEALGYEAQLQAEVRERRAQEVARTAALRSDAWLVQGSTLLGVMCCLGLAAALAGWVAGGRRWRWVQAGLRYGPPLLVASCVLLPLAYHPYARTFADYLNGTGEPNPRALWSFVSLWSIPQAAWSPGGGPYLWWSVIGVGGAASVWLLGRAVRRALA